MTMKRTGAEVDAAIGRIAAVIAAEADASEQMQQASPRLVEALHAERLFRLWIPASLDGDELDLPASLEAFESVARLDGSAGWTVMIGVGGGLFAAFMQRAAAEEVFLPDRALIAGSGSPSGRASIAAGGYRAGGHWAYASGAHQATWFTANCVVEREGQPVTGGDGRPLVRAMAFPASAVEIIPNWSVLGMRGTGSHDFAVAESFVPEAMTFSVSTDAPREPGPLYRFPFAAVAELSFGAVALGIAAHALDEFAALAAHKSVYGSTQALASHPAVKIATDDAHATLASARAWFYTTAEAAWRSIVGGQPLSPAASGDAHLASVHAARASARAADMVFELSRTAVVRDGDVLGRAWRDVHVVRQHAALSPVSPVMDPAGSSG